MMEEKVTYRRDPARNPVETERTRNRRVYVPKADIIETADSMVLYADMPGADEKSVDVTIEKNILTISAAVTPAEAEGRSMFYAEYDIGDYERAFTISDEVDRDRIDAVVRNGVLKLTLHKVPQAEARKITVRTE
ncbi:MAG: Hsp20/alpha crystallin family protein [Deltaproteobacteria bacterium]|nr:Hsp20/alpha crystallin family protein [Deltaproteobacteria bacterium]